MVKPATMWGKGTTALLPQKSSQNLVDALPGKTNSRTQGAAISKKSPVTHCRALNTHNTVPKSIKTHSSSVKSVAAASEVGSQSGDGDTPVAGQRSHSGKVSKSKVVGCKSLGSTLRFPPPISWKMGGEKVDTTTGHTIQKPACFSQQDINSHSSVGQLWAWGPWKSCSKIGAAKVGWVWSLSPMDLDDSNPDPAASDVSLGHLNETDWSQPTPCNSRESSPVPEGHCHHDDNVVELEASQDELDELNRDESTDFSMETSLDSQVLKCKLHEKWKQFKKAEKQPDFNNFIHSWLKRTTS